LTTAIGNPQLSGRVARETAQNLLGVLDHNHGRPRDRGRLFDELVHQLQRGRIDETALLPKVKAVFERSSITVIGPAGAELSAEAVTSMLSMRMLAAVELQRKQTPRGRSARPDPLPGAAITDEQLLTVRLQHRAALAEYTQLHETLAKQAGSLAQLFEQPTLQEQVLSSVPTLLYLVGLQLRRQQDAAGRDQP
jgi:hypothetical protein